MLLNHQRGKSNYILALGNQDPTRCLQAPLHDTEPQKVMGPFLHSSIGFPLLCVLLSSPASYNILPWGLKENNRLFKGACANFISLHGSGIQHTAERSVQSRSPRRFLRYNLEEQSALPKPISYLDTRQGPLFGMRYTADCMWWT